MKGYIETVFSLAVTISEGLRFVPRQPGCPVPPLSTTQPDGGGGCPGHTARSCHQLCSQCLLLVAPAREDVQVGIHPTAFLITSWHAGRVHRIGPTPPRASPAFLSECFSRLWPWNRQVPHPTHPQPSRRPVLLRSPLLTTTRCC